MSDFEAKMHRIRFWLGLQALQTLFTGLIMCKITYALPSFAGQLTADDRNRIGAISRKVYGQKTTGQKATIVEIL